jgi:hypothetical protein
MLRSTPEVSAVRTRRFAWAGAAVLAVAVVAAILVWARSGDGDTTTDVEPSADSAASTVLTVTVVPGTSSTTDSSAADTSTTRPPTTTVPAPSTAPPATAPPVTPDRSSALIPAGADIRPSATPQVLYEAGVGAAANQLGLEDCSECDPIRPLSPMLATDGRLLIVDTQNRRLVSVTAGVPSTVPLPEGFLPWDALMGPSDVVYLAGFTETPQGPANPQLIAVDARDPATVLSRSPITGDGLGMLRFDGDEVVLVLDTEQSFPLARPGPAGTPIVDPQHDHDPPSLVVTASGGSTTWTVEPGWEEAVPLADGSVAVLGAVDIDGSGTRVVWRLEPDRSWVGEQIAARSAAANGGPSVSEQGVVVLERDGGSWRVVRFPLPG